MTLDWWLLALLAVGLGVMHVLHSWRLTVSGLGLCYGVVTALVALQPYGDVVGGWSLHVLAQVEVVTTIIVTGMLFVTGQAFMPQQAERAVMPRWIEMVTNLQPRQLFYALKQRPFSHQQLRLRYAKYFLFVVFALVVLGVIVVLPLLTTLPGLAGQALRYAGALLTLNGLLHLLFAEQTIKWGIGPVLVVLGIQVLYVALSPSVGLLIFGLLAVAMIALTLAAACLSSMLYNQSQTLVLVGSYETVVDEQVAS